MESCSVAFNTKRHRRHSGKLGGMCRAHQPGYKLGERLRRLGYYWPKMISDTITMLIDAIPVRSMVILSIKHWDVFIQCLLHGHLRCGEWMSLDP